MLILEAKSIPLHHNIWCCPPIPNLSLVKMRDQASSYIIWFLATFLIICALYHVLHTFLLARQMVRILTSLVRFGFLKCCWQDLTYSWYICHTGTSLSHSGLWLFMYCTDVETLANILFDFVFVIMMPSIN